MRNFLKRGRISKEMDILPKQERKLNNCDVYLLANFIWNYSNNEMYMIIIISFRGNCEAYFFTSGRTRKNYFIKIEILSFQ